MAEQERARNHAGLAERMEKRAREYADDAGRVAEPLHAGTELPPRISNGEDPA